MCVSTCMITYAHNMVNNRMTVFDNYPHIFNEHDANIMRSWKKFEGHSELTRKLTWLAVIGVFFIFSLAWPITALYIIWKKL